VKPVTAASVASFAVAFVGSVVLWWLYFDQSAGAAAEMIARSDDPGRLGRSAYHLIHPVMVVGIIVCAAADEKVLADPGAVASTASTWMILGARRCSWPGTPPSSWWCGASCPGRGWPGSRCSASWPWPPAPSRP
jgi:low temperature requirement protein LtrA